MRSQFICKLLITFITLLFLPAAFAAQKYASVEEMVANQKNIRVLIDTAPGYGNQSASLNLMNRLRQMNFNGTFEVIYPDDVRDPADDYNIRQKVINLFNLPKDLPPVYTYEDSNKRKIVFIAETEYVKNLKQKLVTPTQLSVTGAHDSNQDVICMKEQNLWSTCQNFADYTNSDVFLEMQPWFENPDDGFLTRGSDGKVQMVTPPGKFLIFPVATLSDAKKFLIEDPNGKTLLEKKPAINTFIEGIEAHSFNVLPVYGYTFRKSYNWLYDDNGGANENYESLVYPQNILEVISAARYVQLTGPTELRKPVIIPVFYDYREEIIELKELVAATTWSDKHYEREGGAEMRAAIKTLNLNDPNVFLIADIADKDASEKISALKPGQLLLLSMGSLPKVVFDGIYTHTDSNVWPQMREGQSSLNILILTGKPHFRCNSAFEDPGVSRWEVGFDFVQDAALKSKLENFYNDKGFCAVSEMWKSNPLLYQTLGQFIIDSTNPNSSISHAFADLKEETKKPENDRIYRGLQEVLKVINTSN